MDPFFAWIEGTALSVWVRESPSLWAFPFILILHAVGMGFLMGANVAVDLRVLGFAPRVPLSVMERFFPIMWFGFVVNAVSGFILLAGYPTKALTSPLFYVKLLLIALALLHTRWIRDHALRDASLEHRGAPAKIRMAAVSSIVFWAGAVTSGRLLAYTYTRLMVDG